jgi:hypothetical protein
MRRYPIIMDAMASEVQRKGDAFMSKWAEIMTNMQPKTYFFRPDVAAQVGCKGCAGCCVVDSTKGMLHGLLCVDCL